MTIYTGSAYPVTQQRKLPLSRYPGRLGERDRWLQEARTQTEQVGYNYGVVTSPQNPHPVDS